MCSVMESLEIARRAFFVQDRDQQKENLEF